jgi:hypothetical protein
MQTLHITVSEAEIRQYQLESDTMLFADLVARIRQELTQPQLGENQTISLTKHLETILQEDASLLHRLAQ